MPRRAVLSDEQRAALLALPDDETLLVQHWTLSRDDLAIIVRRRRPHNRLGFAIQLCALRYPGRFLRPGELIPDTPLAFVAEQLQVGPEVLADYATRGPTRYEQLDALRDAFGFMPLSRPLRTTLQEWLLPIALTTTSGARLARVMLDECRRRRIIVPGISSVERMVAQALLDAERHVAEHLTRGLDARQRRLLDALLLPHTGTNLSDLAWVRQSPGKPGRKTFAAIIERLTLLRAIGIDPDIAVGVHPERLRRLCQEGVRLTAQHVRTLQATRRRATLVATILETIVTLTDDAVLMFDRLLGQMFRREQNRGLSSNGTENLHKPSSRLSPVRVVMDITAQHAVYFGLVSPRLRVILEPAHHIGIEPQGNGFFARLVKTGTLCQSPILNRCLGNIRRVDVSVRHVH
jgi:hypothetical protein|tara:strand:- start:669 stop:1886 length:1218 start_codon:yes stop_codon:yes gene_type:complete